MGDVVYWGKGGDFVVYLRTERLWLRNLEKDDRAAVFAYRNDPECAKYQRWEDTSMEAVEALIEGAKEDVFLSEKEEQHYALCDREGLVGDLSYFYTAEDRCITLGITLSPEHQRKGYAFEMLQAVVRSVQKEYPELDIVALIDRENGASVALFEKLGFYRECYAESIQSYVYVIDGMKI